jgi:S-DNA-T family DNA segregation ATPase FtsK/SpoIIIE
MDVVVRTPHGEAELVLRSAVSELVLSDLLERVTGQPSPPVVSVDGRAVPASSSVAASGCVAGSVLSTLEPESVRPGAVDPVVTLVQVAGTGAGTRVDLGPGEYRIGPGRRVTAPELDFAPVDESAMLLTVQEDGIVALADTSGPAWVDGQRVEPGEQAPWTGGLVQVENRVFELEHRDRDLPWAGPRSGGTDGRIPFNRPPRRIASAQDASADSAHLADALRMTDHDHRRLWQRRAGDPDSFHIGVGVAATPSRDGEARRPLRTITVDLQAERGLGIVGGSDFTRAATRGLVLEAVTAFGPADLDIAVVTSRARLHVWEWMKWLPHTDVGAGPQLLAEESEIRSWAETHSSARSGAATGNLSGHLTMVVVDEPAWWHDRTSPLRVLLADDDAPVRFVVLGGSPEEIPAVCTTVLEERPRRAALLERFLENSTVEGVHAFLPHTSVAVDAARRLAPLDDPELAVPGGSRSAELSLERMLGLRGADTGTFAARWFATRGGRAVSTPIGRSAEGSVEFTLAGGGLELLVAGSPGTGTGAVLEGIVVGLAANHQPDDVNFMLFDLSGRGTFDTCAGLPHVVESMVEPTAPGMQRDGRCLRAELGYRERALADHGVATWEEYAARPGAPALPRLLLVLDEAAPTAAERAEFVGSLLDIVERGRDLGLHLVAGTQRPRALDRSIAAAARRTLALRTERDAGDEPPHADHAPVDVRIADRGSRWADDLPDLPRFAPGRAALIERGSTVHFQVATSFGPALSAQSAQAITPFVVGREPTVLEQRLMRVNMLAPDRSDEPALARTVSTIAAAAVELGQSRQRRPCPPPLPTRLTLRGMLDSYAGDGVPYGLEDRPDEQRQRPRWWQPGPLGGLAIYGGSPIERTALLTTLVLGIAERASADDLHLYLAADLTATPALERLRELPHVGAVVGIDDGARLEALVQLLDDEITRRADLAERRGGAASVAANEAAVALLIDDIGVLRQRLRRLRDGDGILLDLERAIRDGVQYGICVVLAASAPRYLPWNLLGGLDQLVLRLDDPSDLGALGIDAADFPPSAPGRAWRPAGRSEVQLAAPPDDLDRAISELGAEPAAERPPRRLPMTGPEAGP